MMARQSSPLTWNILKNQIDGQKAITSLNLRLVRQGDELIGPCPLPTHGGEDTNPSFGINPTKMVWNCFKCGEGGSLPQLIATLDGIEYSDAIERLIGFVPGGVGEVADDWQDRLRTILLWDETEEDIQFPVFSPAVLKPWQAYPIHAFTKRHISEETQRKFSLGYDPEHYRRLKSGEEYVGKAIIIPHFFEGSLVGYQSGWLDEDRPKKVPKYTNTRNFPKAETLFNYDRAKLAPPGETVYVVEAPISAMYLDTLGYTGVATFGAELTDTQLDLLMDFDVIAAFGDNDDSGKKFNRQLCRELGNVVDVSVVEPVKIEKGDINDLAPQPAQRHLYMPRTPSYLWLSTEGA